MYHEALNYMDTSEIALYLYECGYLVFEDEEEMIDYILSHPEIREKIKEVLLSE